MKSNHARPGLRRLLLLVLILAGGAGLFLLWRGVKPLEPEESEKSAAAPPPVAATPGGTPTKLSADLVPQDQPLAAHALAMKNDDEPAAGSGRDKHANLDARHAPAAEPTTAQQAALTKLRQRMPGVGVQFDPVTGSPSDITATGEFLTPTAVSAGGDLYEPVKRFVDENAALFGHGAQALQGTRVTREDVNAQSGMRTVVWQQQVDAVPVYNTILRANLTKNGELITIGSQFLADPQTATRMPPAERAALIAQPPIDVAKAVSLAAAHLGDNVAPADARPISEPQGAERRQRLEAPGLSDTNAGLAWLPMSATSLQLTWDVTLMSRARNEMFRVLVDARTGEVLMRTSLTNDISNASYRVYADATSFKPFDSPAPMSPGLSTPASTQAATASRSLITLQALDTTASPNGWIDDGGTTTSGNNVDAHLDLLNTNPAYGAGTRATSATRVFDFTLDLSQDPSIYQSGAITTLFYLCNWYHDKVYALGFTESAGNFQQNNFGKGGTGNDAVLADVQDSASLTATGTNRNNANFSTPADGSPGRMQMYIFPGPSPARDGDLDAEIVLHEHTHGLSSRLVGGGVGISAVQTQGMGEGWSDFYGLSLLSDPTDNVNGNYAAGAYATYQLSGLTSNYYSGIRRYPYSTDLTKNPLTLKDIDPTKASAHPGIALSPIFSAPNVNSAEVHNQGEVWCVSLWDMRASLINKLGAAAGNQMALQLVTDGMKLSPANPTFLQARSAIIQADLVDNGGANKTILWAAFAKRGLGFSATVPANSTTTGVVEAFDVPDTLTVTPAGGFTSTGPVGGPFGPLVRTYTLTNTSAASLNWTAAKTQTWLALSPFSGTLAQGASVTVTATIDNVAIAAFAAASYADTITITNTTSGIAANFPVTLEITAPQAPTLFDSLTGATLTFISNTPRTFIGMPVGLGAAGGSTNIKVSGGKLYMLAATATAYSAIRANVTFWGTASGATSGATPAFSNPLGTVALDYGAITTAVNNFYTLNFTLGSPVNLPSQIAGITVNFQGNSGSGLASTDNLTPLLRYGTAVTTGSLTLGTAGTNGFYRNGSGEVDGNFPGSDFNSFGFTNQGLVVQLFGSALQPAVLTNAATNVNAGGATLNAGVNALGSATTVFFQYGTTTNYDNTASTSITPNNGVVAQNATATVSGLALNTTIHYRVVATNSLGTSVGLDQTFTTANQAPIVTATSSSFAYLENQSATSIDPGLTVTDADSANLASATVALTSGFATGEDVLAFSNQNGITGSWNAAAGVLTLTGSSTVQNYQAALRSVTYQDASDNPSAVARTVTFAANDGTSPGTAARTIAVTPVNDAPTLDAITDRVPIQPNSGLQTVSLTGISAGGGESQTLTVTVTGNTNPTLIPSPSIAYTSPSATGTLTYTPAANSSGTATLTVQVADSGGTLNGGVDRNTRSFLVTVNNGAPVVTATTAALAYLENQAATAIDPGLTVTDFDSTNLSGATVAITGNFASGEDTLAFANQGGITGAYVAATGVLTLSGTATLATYQAALRSVTYVNTSDNPSGLARTITFTANDGQSVNNLGSATRNITVTPVNDVPTLDAISDRVAIQPNAGLQTVNLTGISAGGGESQTLTVTVSGNTNPTLIPSPSITYTSPTATGTLTYTPAANSSGTATLTVQVADNGGTLNGGVDRTTRSFLVTVNNGAPVVTATTAALAYLENQAATVIDPGLTVTDFDSTNLTGATVAITGNFASAQDTLAFANQGGITGSYVAATGVLTLSGTATLATYQAALRSVTYANTSDNPSALSRTITFTANDGQSVNNLGSATRNITVTPVNDVPTLDAISDRAPISQNSGVQTVSLTGISAGGGESQTLTLTVTGNNNPTLIPSPSITYSSPAATGTLTYTPAANTIGTATITVQVADDGGTANGGVDRTTRSFLVTVNNTSPVVTATTGSLAYLENQAATAIDPLLTVTDPDSTNLTGGSVAITGNFAGTQDVLGFTNQNGITGSYVAATGVVTLSGTTTVANYQAALRSVTYANTSDNPSTLARTVTFMVTDGTSPGTAARTIAVTPVNDIPTLDVITDRTPIQPNSGLQTVNLSGISAGGGESQTLTVTVSGNTNPTLIPSPSITYTSPNATGTLTYTPATNSSGTATLTVQVADNGGTLNGGVDRTTRSFLVTVNNGAPVVTTTTAALAYLENQAATAIDPALTVTDFDSTNLTVGSVAITGNFSAAQDTLGFVNQGGITGSYVPATGVLTLTGTATVAVYQAALRTVTYVNASDNPSSLARTITFTVSDGNSPGSATRTITVTPVNDVPTLDAISDRAPIQPNSGPQSVSLTGISAGGGESQTLTVTVTGNTNPTLIPSPSITYTSPAAAGTLSYTPAANSSGTATLTVQVADDGGTANGGVDRVTRSFLVTVNNGAPVVTATTAALAYLENQVASAVDSALTVTDFDSANLTGATVGITGNFVAAQDTLAFTNQGGITGSYVAATGVLTLSGTATVAAYQAALRSVTYVNNSDNPSALARTVTFTVNDGQSVNNLGSATRSITVTPVNDVPTLDAISDRAPIQQNSGLQTVNLTGVSAGGGESQGLTVTVTGNTNPTLVPSPSISYTSPAATGTLTYTAAANTMGTATITVQVADDGGTANGGVDRTTRSFLITVNNASPVVTATGGSLAYLENQAATAIDPLLTATDADSTNLTGATVAISGNLASSEDVLGFAAQNGITGTYVTATGILTLSGTTSPANYQAALRSVTYANTSDNPSALTRTVTFTVSDGNSPGSGARTIAVTPVNDAPTLAAISDRPPIQPNSAVQTVSLTGISPGGGESQTLTVTVTGNTNPSLIPSPAITYTSPAATGTLTYTPAANSSGTATLTVQVADNGGTANGGVDRVTRSFLVTVNNGAPVVTATVTALTYLENQAATAVDSALTVTDFDSANLTGATVAITGNFVAAQDTLGFASQGGITGSYASATGVLTLSGTASVAAYQAALRSVTYANSSDTPATAARTVTFTANDGQAVNNLGTATRAIAVVAVNDPPTGTSNTVSINENTPYTVAAADFGFSDAKDAGANSLLAVRITTAPTAGVLADNGASLAAGSAVTVADLSAGLVKYTPGLHGNGAGYASFTFQVQDNGGTASGGVDLDPVPKQFTFNVVAINDAPTFTKGANVTVLEDAGAQSIPGWATAISAGPADESAQTLNFLVTNDQAALFSAAPAVAANGTLTFTPAPDANGSATVTVRLHDNGGTANGGVDTSAPQTFTIAVTAANDAPTLAALTPVMLIEGAGEQVVNLSGIGTGAANEADTLVVTAQSSDTAAIPTPTITYTSPNATGTLRFTPAAHVNGKVTITVTVNDGGAENATVSRSFDVTMMSVNDAPSFTKGSDQAVDEDSGPQTIAAWATGISAGPLDEAGQTLNFLVDVDQSALFATAPAVDANGVLTFTSAPDANGVAMVTVRLHDDGGTANGGSDTSAPQIFKITINAVNDSPSFTKGADQAVRRDAGPQTVPGWATALSAGPANESAQTLNFLVSVDTPALFATAPAVAPNGTLTFEPATGATGTATVTVRLHDSGGTTPGVDTSAPQTFTISVTLYNVAPSFTVGPDQTVAQDAGLQTVSGWAKNISPGPASESAQVLDFLVVADNPALFTVAPAIAADGTLTFTPDPKASGTTTVTVRLHDNGGTANNGADTSAPQTFHISVATFFEELGAYNGLAGAAGNAPASHERSGLVKVTFTKTGVFTGSLVLAGRRYVLSGHVGKTGGTTFGRLKTAALDLKRLNATTLSLSLTLDVTGGTGKLTGAISDAGAPFAVIDADRVAYTAARKPVAPLISVPPALLGRYTVIFPAKTPAEQGLAASAYPQGDGVGTLTISTAGVAKVVGTLADGTKISYANSLSKANAWPVYVSLARGTGALTGPARFEPGPSPSDLDGLGLHWFKPASRALIYPLGWSTGITLDLLGAKYALPPRLPAQSVFPQLPPTVATGNLLAEFGGGNLPVAGLSKALNLSTADRATIVQVGPDKLSLAVVRTTGQIVGSFIDPTTKRRRTVNAVVFQKQSLASGFFLGSSESGPVTITEVPAH